MDSGTRLAAQARLGREAKSRSLQGNSRFGDALKARPYIHEAQCEEGTGRNACLTRSLHVASGADYFRRSVA